MYVLLSVVNTALDGDKTHDLYRLWLVSSGETVLALTDHFVAKSITIN